MPQNRKRKAISRRINKFNKRFKYTAPGKSRVARKMYKSKKSRFARAVKAVVHNLAETKEYMLPVCTNNPLNHNVVTNLSNNAFSTIIGTSGEATSGQGVRIGNKIFAKKIRVSLMIESQQYRPLASYWLYLVRLKGAAADTTCSAKTQMFEDVSSTIPMDWLDTSKCDIMFCKKFVLRMPNMGTLDTMGGGGTGGDPPGSEAGGTHVTGQQNLRITNPQIITKFNVPLNCNIMYKDSNLGTPDNMQPHSFRYQWVMIAYDNFTSAGGATWPVGHVTMTTKLTFVDI
nr:capsid protein [Cressdnaviricota sp.]